MILKALYDYYHRCDDMPPFGLTEKEISFIIVIDDKGKFLRVEDRRIDDNSAQTFLVVPGFRTSGIKPYLFYDNIEYVCGYGKDSSQKNDAFIEQCRKIAEKYAKFEPVVSFYNSGGLECLYKSNLWDDMINAKGVNISFIIGGETEIIASAKELINEFASTEDLSKICTCLITGKKSHPIEITTATKIPGSQATARLISFQEKSGYDSYGKTKGFNAPISKEGEFAYTTALRRLLGKNSKNKFYIGNRTFLFWASSKSEGAQLTETNLFDFFSNTKDNPNYGIDYMRKNFRSIYSGEKPCDTNDRFYILGLAPNAARIAVVYWNETSIKDFAKIILQHFDDMEIIDSHSNQRPYCGLIQMMCTVTVSGKLSDVQPNLPETTIKSIFQGLPYPQPLYTAVLRRIRAELSNDMYIERIAILKAYLNRINNNNYKLLPMLDLKYKNIGYLCGRLFAVLEYAQKRANNSTTIRGRYMSAASSNPATVFPTLLNLNIHHIEKLNNERTEIYLERLKQEIVDSLPSDGFPAHLDLNDQGRFFVGYYQQKQDLYTTKDNN